VPTGWFNDVYVSGKSSSNLGKPPTGATHHRAHKCRSGRKMETIEEQRTHRGSINLVSLKTEILSALSTVGTRQASKNSGRRTRPIRKLSAPLEAWVIARTSEPGIANKLKWSGWPWGRRPSVKVTPILRDKCRRHPKGKDVECHKSLLRCTALTTQRLFDWGKNR